MSLNPETIAEFLSLPTIDDTQTAFATSNIFISETTAAHWRSMGDLYAVVETVATVTPATPTPEDAGCWAMVSSWGRRQRLTPPPLPRLLSRRPTWP